jgi:AcrR family transcriptional regulator
MEHASSEKLNEATSPARAPGRPRDPRTDEAILSATLKLLAEDGAHDLRMDDVARRAGVGKAAIYRRYDSKDQLMTAAIATTVSEIKIPETGSTRGDLLELMRQAVAVYTDPTMAGLMPGLIAAVRRSPELAKAVSEGFLTRRRVALSLVLKRGVGRGDLRSDLDLELALDVLGGPLFYRLLVTGGPIDEQLAAGVVELIMRGFGTSGPGARRPSRTGDRK